MLEFDTGVGRCEVQLASLEVWTKLTFRDVNS